MCIHVSCTLMVSRALNDEQTCTPPTAHNTKIAPSRTLSDRSTSTVKSTCPRISKVMPKPLTCMLLISHCYSLQNFAHYAVLLSVGLSSVTQGYQKRTTSSFAHISFQPKTIKLRWDDEFVILTLASVMEIKFCGVAIQMNEYLMLPHKFQT